MKVVAIVSLALLGAFSGLCSTFYLLGLIGLFGSFSGDIFGIVGAMMFFGFVIAGACFRGISVLTKDK